MTKRKKVPTFKVVGINCDSNKKYMAFSLLITTLFKPVNELGEPVTHIEIRPPTIRSLS